LALFSCYIFPRKFHPPTWLQLSPKTEEFQTFSTTELFSLLKVHIIQGSIRHLLDVSKLPPTACTKINPSFPSMPTKLAFPVFVHLRNCYHHSIGYSSQKYRHYPCLFMLLHTTCHTDVEYQSFSIKNSLFSYSSLELRPTLPAAWITVFSERALPLFPLLPIHFEARMIF
jgi:hypothetical protein